MDHRKLSRINNLGREIMALESRLASVQFHIQAARERLNEDNLTFREWNEAAHEYGISSGSAFALDRRLQVVRGRFHFVAATV
jgi:hypothetical protein